MTTRKQYLPDFRVTAYINSQQLWQSYLCKLNLDNFSMENGCKYKVPPLAEEVLAIGSYEEIGIQ